MSTTQHLDYLIGADGDRLPPDASASGCTQAGARYLRRVASAGTRLSHGAAQSRGAWLPESHRAASFGMLAGLHRLAVPFVFRVMCVNGSVEVAFGSWDPFREARDSPPFLIDSHLQAMRPSMELVEASEHLPRFERGGVALGCPAVTVGESTEPALPMDRLIRGMLHFDWAVLVLAQPAAMAAVLRLRNIALGELTAARRASSSEGPESSLAASYVDGATRLVARLQEAQRVGSWRTATYLLGDPKSYPQLVSNWLATFSGASAHDEIIRVVDHPEVVDLAQRWALPELGSPKGPGHWQRPFAMQTLLTSAELATLAELPVEEVPGYAVRFAPPFGTALAATDSAGVHFPLGKVLAGRQELPASYQVPVSTLQRHALVCGMTGAGKTNTISHILLESSSRGTPFLILEPTKCEYRALASHFQDLRLFTAGEERICPIRLNPLEVHSGSSVLAHIDLLKALFTTVFGLWTPLPEILETALHNTYRAYGWDVLSNRNLRADGKSTLGLFPQLGDLRDELERLVPTLQYAREASANIRAALITRVSSLLVGGKGAMLDVPASTAASELFDRRAVVELEHLGNDSDKALVMGLLLIKLAEYRRQQGTTDELRHLLVLEEAHRVLARPGGNRSQRPQADPGSQAISTFTNLLAEVRAYGQGIVVADQVPTKLAPEVLKNTGLKIGHRLSAEDDQLAFGLASGMSHDMSRSLVTLDVGEAVVFGSRDKRPLLVRMPRRPWGSRLSDEAARERAQLPEPDWSKLRLAALARETSERGIVRDAAWRLFQSAVVDPQAVNRLWTDLVDAVQVERAGHDSVDLEALVHGCLTIAAARFARRQAVGEAWTLSVERRYAADLMLLVQRVRGDTEDGVASLRDAFSQAHDVGTGPLHGCERICPDGKCWFRTSARAVAARHSALNEWRDREQSDRDAKTVRRWLYAKREAIRFVESPDASLLSNASRKSIHDAVIRASQCVYQHLVLASQSRPDLMRTEIDGMIEATGARRGGGVAGGSARGP